ncbi:NAD-dependent epimerase/dehydratase family protein [Salmonella enterica]|nr:NAD-dependent epimerase/dehydratase family protein [Salmonella enterica]
MQIIITGGGGFLGQKLASALLNSSLAFNELLLVDLKMPARLSDSPRLRCLEADLTQPGVLENVITANTSVVYHLAAIVSSHAEDDFDLGWKVNLDLTRQLLEACRRQPQKIRFVFSSSLAVYGGTLPECVTDTTALTPRSSYGAQKAACELLVNDYTRKGYVDGLALRLPTICVRPGKPNRAASSFVSAIIREPLQGETTICPVSESLRLWISSPATVIHNLSLAATLPAPGEASSINLPGISVTVGEMLETLRQAGGLVVTHHTVPPTPGPLGVAGIFNVDIGAMLLTGMALAVPCVIGIVFYAQWLDKRYPDFVPRTLNADEVNAALEQYNKEKEQKDLPSLTLSLLPIVVPIVLIFLKAICSTLATVEGWSGLATHPVVQAINFVGSPVIALAISVLLAVYTLVPRMDKHTTAERLEEGLQSAGIILLVTGAGGALGAILRDSGAGQQLAEQVANLPISPILIPFIVATLVRLIQGSGTVAMITAASISAPILAQIPGINMLLAAQAATMGSLFFGYFNDSLFWVVNRMMGVSDVKQQMVVWSVPTTIAWAIGGTGVALINLLFGSGGSWLDPLLPIVVLAAIMLWVRWQAQGIKDKLVVKD